MSRGTVLLAVAAVIVAVPLSWLVSGIGVPRPYSTWVAVLVWMLAGVAILLALDHRQQKGSAGADPESRRD